MCVWNRDINAETWSETYQLKVRVTNQMNTIESPGYHHWKSALIADNSQKKSISFNSNTPCLLLKRTILPSKPYYVDTGPHNWDMKCHQVLLCPNTSSITLEDVICVVYHCNSVCVD